MSDLISRQAAIDAIDEYIEKNRRPDFIGNMVWVSGVADAMRIVSDLPSVQEQRWIPVTERLPEEDMETGKGVQYSADALVTAYNEADDETIVDYAHTVDGEWYSDTTDCFIPKFWKITAWMPLPEPYKERTMLVNLNIEKIEKHQSKIELDDIEAVPNDAYQQVVWKNAVMAEQLNKIGKGFGADMDDVVPVVHGHWEPVTNGRGGFECSKCHHYAPSYQDGVEWLSEWCPSCGAAMNREMEGAEDDA